MCYPAWLAALSSNKYKCWYPFRAEWHHLCGAELSLQGRCGSCVCRGLQQEGLGRARALPVSAVDVLRLAMGREETAVWTALQHTAALLEQRFLWANRARVAAVC